MDLYDLCIYIYIIIYIYIFIFKDIYIYIQCFLSNFFLHLLSFLFSFLKPIKDKTSTVAPSLMPDGAVNIPEEEIKADVMGDKAMCV